MTWVTKNIELFHDILFFVDVPVMDSGMKESLKGFVLANVFIIHFSAW